MARVPMPAGLKRTGRSVWTLFPIWGSSASRSMRPPIGVFQQRIATPTATNVTFWLVGDRSVCGTRAKPWNSTRVVLSGKIASTTSSSSLATTYGEGATVSGQILIELRRPAVHCSRPTSSRIYENRATGGSMPSLYWIWSQRTFGKSE